MEDFSLVARQGVGSYAVVWKARRSDGHLFAIKELKQRDMPWDAVRALPEVSFMGPLSHPNILTLHTVVRVRGRVFLIMDQADASLYQTLQCMTSTGKQFSEPEVRWLMRQLLRGLAYAHGQRIIHRDVKPENLLLCGMCNAEALSVKLCDFGQARLSDSQGKLTEYVSTRWYRAPELLLRSPRYGTPIDIWAAGLVMAELFTGEQAAH
jgi:serine/threonine protein kinase